MSGTCDLFGQFSARSFGCAAQVQWSDAGRIRRGAGSRASAPRRPPRRVARRARAVSPSIAAPCRRCLSNEVEADTEIERPRRAHPAAVDADLAVAQVVAARADTGRQRVRRFRRTLNSCITSDRRVCCAAVGRAVHEAGRVSAFAAGGDAGAADHRATTLWEVRTNPPAVEAVLVDWRARAIPRARFVGSTQRWAAAGGRHGDWSQTTGPDRPPDPGCSAGGAAASRSGRNHWGQPFPATAEGSHAHNEQ